MFFNPSKRNKTLWIEFEQNSIYLLEVGILQTQDDRCQNTENSKISEEISTRRQTQDVDSQETPMLNDNTPEKINDEVENLVTQTCEINVRNKDSVAGTCEIDRDKKPSNSNEITNACNDNVNKQLDNDKLANCNRETSSLGKMRGNDDHEKVKKKNQQTTYKI